MRKRKDYSLSTPAIEDSTVVDGPAPWVLKTSTLAIDFRRWLHPMGDRSKKPVDRGELLDQCREAIWGYRHEMAETSLIQLYESGLCELMRFIDRSKSKARSIDDFTEDDFFELVAALKRGKNTRTGKTVSYLTARRRYVSITTILSYYARRGLFDKRLLPVNPFPNANRQSKGTEPYSQGEMTQIMRALYAEYKAIKGRRSNLSPRVQLAVYQLLIIAKTGINQKPLEEASRDCLQPHPLQPDKAMVLITKKRRGMNTHAVSLRRTGQIEGVNSLPSSAARLLEEAIEITAPLISEAKTEDKDKIWLYIPANSNKVVSYKGIYLNKASLVISEKHGLVNDNGDPFNISTKRLRKTFANRIWQLTNGDVWKTARIMGNTPQVTDRHYLDITPDMERKHQFVGKALEITVRGKERDAQVIKSFAVEANLSLDDARVVLSGEYNTGVSRCSSPFNGQFSKGDGSPCTRFLDCFRCPNQIVLEDDLHRLYSFYWLILRERNTLGRKRWKKLYSWIIREIDNSIAKVFSDDSVAEAKEYAMLHPHPMWAKRDILGADNG
ncbi:MAG: hypothetical protein V3T17_05320 [Pseudomonadales bacterium]